ncbi:transposase [Paenibacillus sp. D51F]
MNDVEDNIREIMEKLDFKLNTFTGIDYITASATVAEIGDISRFAGADKLAKYEGLSPSQMSSGGRGKERKTTARKQSLKLDSRKASSDG